MKDVNQVNDKQFVELWIAGYKAGIGLKGLVSQQSWVYVTASQRASKLRKAGVKLPTMKAATTVRTALETNVPELNKIISDELGAEALNWRAR